ncbi:hypothetical protein [Baaleninema simplex]|uniref:hypothetical protein n=1 Tax=Baaleninema simplex TaxID=2862350 RepID=UPI0003473743|nr:hypothetical protein [Baaleninema simplex]
MFVPTSSSVVRDSAETIAQGAILLLNTRSHVLRRLLRCYWVWQVPGLSGWVVRLALQSYRTQPFTCPCRYSDIVEVARLLLGDRDSVKPLAARQSSLKSAFEEIERNAWLRPAVLSYFADRLRESERPVRF